MATHAELIKAGSFDEKFKNALRDYYSYGFKSYGDFESSKTTVNADWERLNNILQDYFEWSFDKCTAFFASADSQSMQENPFQRVYCFCRYNDRDPVFFFNTILALAPKVMLRDGVDSLGLDYDIIMRLEDDIVDNKPLSSSELACFCNDDSEPFDGNNNMINKRLSELRDLGVLIQPNRKRNSTNRWVLNSFATRQLIESGRTTNSQFEYHLIRAVDFFSKYMPLGTVGSHIKHRLCCDNSSPFRFKHEYFTQALNDYNLIDLLYAIENGYWCEIEYSYAIAKTKTTLICFPLDVKISSVNGREYVSYYEPFKRSYSNLRLELIDSIKYINDGDITDAVSGRAIFLKDPDIENDIKNAHHSMNYSWGISTTVEQVGNAIDPAPKRTVKLRVFYDSQTEQFIVNRLQREKRAGTVAVSDRYIDFEADVSDDREMKPWIRSFYSRILSMEGLSEDMLSEMDTSDIRQISQALQWSNIGHTIKPPSAPPEIWGIPEHIVVKRRQPATVHSALFNEIFSLYYRAWANVLTELYSAPDKEHYFESEIDGIISEVLKGLKNESGAHTGRLLRKELKKAMTSNNSFLRKGYVRDDKWVDTAPASARKETTIGFRPKYSTTSENFFADTLPLTTLECRWLATMINDPKIDIFLSESEIAAIRAFLQSLEPERAKPLPFDKIHYFDRYTPTAETKQQEKAAMPILLDAIRNNCVIELHYISAQQDKITGKFRPIVIEYSKKDDLFRAYFQSCVDDRISVMNLGRVENVILTNDTFNRSEAEAAFKDYREQNTKSVQIEFRDTRNVPDRILSEFSPWKKKCVYDKDSEKYRLTVYYQGSDELELVVRLMGYGADIIFCDRENDIYKEIVRRVERQIELTRDYDLVR